MKNKIVCITGASSGIGEACAEKFAALGADLILVARRIDRLQNLAKKLQEKYSVRVHTLPLDVSKKEDVKKAFESLPKDWKNIQILVNNAGLAQGTNKMQEASLEDWDRMIDTNLHGFLYVIHAILPGMVERQSGHIINLGSIAGFQCYPGGNIYSATKHAVKAISQSLRIDLLGTPLRVTEIAPGAVETEFSEVRWKDKTRAKAFYEDFTPLKAEDIADAVTYAATRPPHVNIADIVIYPTDQASATLIHRGK